MIREIVFATIFSLLFCLDVIGNTLVILVVAKYRAMQTPMNYLLLALAVADITVGIFFAPSFIFGENMITHPTGTTGDILCKTLTGRNVGWIASLVAAGILVVVAAERFHAVVHPTSFKRRINMRRVKRIVPTCWILATIHTIPSFIYKAYDAGSSTCRGMYTHNFKTAYFLLWLVSAGVVPVAMMTFYYSKVIHSLWMQREATHSTRPTLIKTRKRITKKSITVSIIFAVCVFPTHVLDVILIFYPRLISDDDLYFKITYTFLMFNSTVNPLVYTFQWDSFKTYLIKLFGFSRKVRSQRDRVQKDTGQELTYLEPHL